jgi:hypothetical protein
MRGKYSRNRRGNVSTQQKRKQRRQRRKQRRIE